jgi:hypothetical protein
VDNWAHNGEIHRNGASHVFENPYICTIQDIGLHDDIVADVPEPYFDNYFLPNNKMDARIADCVSHCQFVGTHRHIDNNFDE